MIRRLLVIAWAALAYMMASSSEASAAGVACADLTTLSLPDTTITAAQEVRAGGVPAA